MLNVVVVLNFLMNVYLSHAAHSTEEIAKTLEQPPQTEVVLAVNKNNTVVVIENGLIHSVHEADKAKNEDLSEEESPFDISEDLDDGVYVVSPDKDDKSKKSFIRAFELSEADMTGSALTEFALKNKKDQFSVSIRPKLEAKEKPLIVQNLEGGKETSVHVGIEFKLNSSPRNY